MIDSDASVDFGQWVADVEQKRILYFPDTEVGRAKICYGFLKEGAGAGSFRGLLSLGRTFNRSMKFEDILRDINDKVVEPFINFIHDQIDDSGNVLYLIERFKLSLSVNGSGVMSCIVCMRKTRATVNAILTKNYALDSSMVGLTILSQNPRPHQDEPMLLHCSNQTIHWSSK